MYGWFSSKHFFVLFTCLFVCYVVTVCSLLFCNCYLYSNWLSVVFRPSIGCLAVFTVCPIDCLVMLIVITPILMTNEMVLFYFGPFTVLCFK